MVHIMHRDSRQQQFNERIDAFFIAKKRKGELINKEPEKCDDLAWFDLDNPPTNTIPYIKQAIHYIKQGIFYSEYGRPTNKTT